MARIQYMSAYQSIAEYQKSDQFKQNMARMQDSLLEMGRICSDDAKAEFADFHYELEGVLQDETLKRLNIICPRGHAKSSIASKFFVLWVLFCEDAYYGRPQQRKNIVLASRTREKSEEELDWIKHLLTTSRDFKVHFGDWGEKTAQRWTNTMITLKNGSRVTCKGAGQQFVGLNYRGLRPTHVILDDLEDETNTQTDHMLDQNMKWLTRSVEPCPDPEGRIINIATPKHRRAISMRLAQSEKTGYKTIHYSAILHENTDRERALWEAWHPLEKLKRDREQARFKGELHSWTQEWMCKITGDTGGFQNIQYWEGRVRSDSDWNIYLEVTHLGDSDTRGDLDAMRELAQPLTVPVNCFLGNDPAISSSQRADDAVNLISGLDAKHRTWTIDIDAGKGVPIDEQVKRILTKGHLYNCRRISVEGYAFQAVIHQNLQKMALTERARIKQWVAEAYAKTFGRELPAREMAYVLPGAHDKNNHSRKPKTGDNSRLGEMQPSFSAGNVYIRARHTKLRDECLDYPNGEDNHLDALYYSRVGAYPPSHTPGMLAEKKRPNERRRAYDWRLLVPQDAKHYA